MEKLYFMNASLDFCPGHINQDGAGVFFSADSELKSGRMFLADGIPFASLTSLRPTGQCVFQLVFMVRC